MARRTKGMVQKLWADHRWRWTGVALLVLAMMVVGLGLLEALARRGATSWLAAIQALATLVVATATVAYVGLTTAMLRQQGQQLVEARAARDDEALVRLATSLQGACWKALEPSSRLFPVSKTTPEDFFVKGVEACRPLSEVQGELLTISRQVPAPVSPDIADFLVKVNSLNLHLLQIHNAIHRVMDAEGRDGARGITWSEVEAAYLLYVRDPNSEDSARRAEWDDVANFDVNSLYGRITDMAEACRHALQHRKPGQRLT